RAPCRAGRHCALPSPPRSAGTSSPLIGLPREEKRRLAENLPLLLQHAILTPQPAQLLALLRRQPLALARVDLALADPTPQRLAGDPELARQLHDRPSRRLHEPHRLLAELRRIRRSRPRHLSLPSGPGSPSAEVSTEAGQPPPPALPLLGVDRDQACLAHQPGDALLAAA